MKKYYFLSQDEVVETARGLKEELGYSDQQISNELKEIGYSVSQQSINKALNGSRSHIRALLSWLEYRVSGSAFSVERDDGQKPVVYYRIEN